MIIELMLMLIAVGAGIVFIAWNNTRRRKQDAIERREVADSTGKLKQELERTANEIIGRMENHVTHLEKILDESEKNRTQLEGRVIELKKLLKKTEGQSGEIRDLLARLEDAGAEVDTMQRKMDAVERRLNLVMTSPFPFQQSMTIPQITQPIVPPIVPPVTPTVPPITSASVTSSVPPITPAPIPRTPPPTVTQVTAPAAPPLNPLGPISMSSMVRPAAPLPKDEVDKVANAPDNEFDKILEKSIAESSQEKSPTPRSSIILSPENKQPVQVVDADPVKIEATRRKLTEASAKMAEKSAEHFEDNQARSLRKKRKSSRSSRPARDVRKAALDAIREAEKSSSESTPVKESKPTALPEKEILPERRDLKLETTDSAIIKEMLLSGMSIEDISRETGLGRGAIELVQEMTRRQLNRK